MHETTTHLLTRQQYRDLTGDSRQNVHNKITRKTLKTVWRPEEVMVERIVLTPEEFATITPKMQVINL